MISKGITKIKNKVINNIIQQIPDAYHSTKEFKIQKSFASLTMSPGTNIINNYQNYSVKLINNKQHEKHSATWLPSGELAVKRDAKSMVYSSWAQLC